MTNSLFSSLTSDAHCSNRTCSVSYMGDLSEFERMFENTFRRTERIKHFLKCTTQRKAISVSNLQL